jgi:hypothetical protein
MNLAPSPSSSRTALALTLLCAACAPSPAATDALDADARSSAVDANANANVDASASMPDRAPTLDDAAVTDAHTPATDAPDAPACAARAVPCADESAMRLRYLTVVNASAITNEPLAGGEFRSIIDARAGGAAVTQSYVYARFTSDGLRKLELTDEDALRSTEWDIALRRFVIRLNSGVSGPSCVLGARASSADWASVTAVADLALGEERYFDGTCQFVDDRSGINGPATILAPYWTYAGCLQMSHAIFVARLRDGRAVKLTVESYYDPDKQRECDETGMVSTPNNAAVLRLRWSFLR